MVIELVKSIPSIHQKEKTGFTTDLRSVIDEYKNYKNEEEDFEEDSEFEKTFTPDREDDFHVKYENIIFNETGEENINQKEYTMEYNQNLIQIGSNPLLSLIKSEFEKAGLDDIEVNEDDNKFRKNLRNTNTPNDPDL